MKAFTQIKYTEYTLGGDQRGNIVFMMNKEIPLKLFDIWSGVKCTQGRWNERTTIQALNTRQNSDTDWLVQKRHTLKEATYERNRKIKIYEKRKCARNEKNIDESKKPDVSRKDNKENS